MMVIFYKLLTVLSLLSMKILYKLGSAKMSMFFIEIEFLHLQNPGNHWKESLQTQKSSCKDLIVSCNRFFN